MKHWMKWSLLFLPFLGEAGGFQVNTQGQKAISMGGSVSGWAMDASVCYFNPGGLTALKSNFLNAGVSFLLPKSTFLGSTGSSESMSSQLYTPFYVYGNYAINQKISVGLSVNTPFGLGTKWEDDWSGRFISREARLNTIFFQPTIAMKLNDKISIGAGPVIALGKANLKKALPVNGTSGEEASLELDGKGNGFGFNAGVYVSLDKLTLGLSYRSKVEMDIEDGDATFTDVPQSLIDNGTFPLSSKFNSAISLPSVLSLGAGYQINEKFTAIFELNYTGWEVYDSLNFEFPDHAQLESRNGKEYKNSIAARIGINYQHAEKLQLRAGLAYDQSPVEDQHLSPELPDGNKIILGIGGTYALKKGWSVEASLMFEDVRERKEVENAENNFIGTYKSNLYVAGIGVQYTF
jgi:long-chain fatty acid transport protein